MPEFLVNRVLFLHSPLVLYAAAAKTDLVSCSCIGFVFLFRYVLL